MTNEIYFLRIAKLKKDGTPSKTEAWIESNYRDGRFDPRALKLIPTLPHYVKFIDMQIAIGEDLYRDHNDRLPDRWFNDIAIKTYLTLKRIGNLEREEKRAQARVQILEMRTKFLGNDPIIGMSALKPEPVKYGSTAIGLQERKVAQLKQTILSAHRHALDFTDYDELHDEQVILLKMQRGEPFTRPSIFNI